MICESSRSFSDSSDGESFLPEIGNKRNKLDDLVTSCFLSLQEGNYNEYEDLRKRLDQAWPGDLNGELPISAEHVTETWKLLAKLPQGQLLRTNYYDETIDPLILEERTGLLVKCHRWNEQAFRVSRLWSYFFCAEMVCKIASGRNQIKYVKMDEFVQSAEVIASMAKKVLTVGVARLFDYYIKYNHAIGEDLKKLRAYYHDVVFVSPPLKVLPTDLQREMLDTHRRIRQYGKSIEEVEKLLEERKAKKKKNKINKIKMIFNRNVLDKVKQALREKKVATPGGVDASEWTDEPTQLPAIPAEAPRESSEEGSSETNPSESAESSRPPETNSSGEKTPAGIATQLQRTKSFSHSSSQQASAEQTDQGAKSKPRMKITRAKSEIFGKEYDAAMYELSKQLKESLSQRRESMEGK